MRLPSCPSGRLVVVGDGPELKQLRAKRRPNVSLLGYQEFAALRDYVERARAFLFASREDFGIVLVEAQAAGTPVIAFGDRGSAGNHSRARRTHAHRSAVRPADAAPWSRRSAPSSSEEHRIRAGRNAAPMPCGLAWTGFIASFISTR